MSKKKLGYEFFLKIQGEDRCRNDTLSISFKCWIPRSDVLSLTIYLNSLKLSTGISLRNFSRFLASKTIKKKVSVILI